MFDLMTRSIALIATASFCDEERRAKDIVESRFPASKNKKAQTNLSFGLFLFGLYFFDLFFDERIFQLHIFAECGIEFQRFLEHCNTF
ncbi:hypothetical protein SAMN04488097_1347 [Epilithonimonas lactis]|nr:hypothetical protein SAMN04488097_1347 [Epilithonimonas lactis]